jgi:polysaccharide biosynthesis protein PslG
MTRKSFVLAAVFLAFASLALCQSKGVLNQSPKPSSSVPRIPPPPTGTASTFFAIDVDAGCCATNDPWPFTGISAQTGVTFATWRTLGSGITWAQLSPCNPLQTSCSLGISWICNSAGRCYNWQKLDNMISTAKTSGQAIMFTATGTPSWISSNTSDGCGPTGSQGQCSPPTDLGSGDTTWKNFITDLINHEGAGNIKYLEIWNEPNNTGSWQGTESQLETMIQDAHGSAKAADSAIKIISPPVTADFGTQYTYPNCAPIDKYLGDLLSLGMFSGGYVDIIGFHGYVPLNNTNYLALDASCVGSLVANVRSVLQSHSVTASTPIYDTESSWLRQYESTIDPGEEASFTGITYIIQASSICTATPCYPLTGYSWYGWDFDASTGAFWDDSSTGTFTNAGIAYVNLYKWLLNATAVAQCSRATNGTWTCNYTKAGGYMARAVWTDSSSCGSGCSYTYPTWANYSRDLVDLNDTDDPLSGGTTTIGYTPIWLENTPLP